MIIARVSWLQSWSRAHRKRDDSECQNNYNNFVCLQLCCGVVQKAKEEEKQKKRNDMRKIKEVFITLGSPVVPLLSTSKADSGLTSEFRWDRVLYTTYERIHKSHTNEQYSLRPIISWQSLTVTTSFNSSQLCRVFACFSLARYISVSPLKFVVLCSLLKHW
jgi:hypothetical protein